MLDKFTIVVPTYNRYRFLLRLLKYYGLYDFPFKIVVLDSSSDLLDLPELKKLFKHKNVIYRKFSPDVYVVDKMAIGIKDITTPYAAFCADDDFIIPRAIEKSTLFLEQNPEYSCAQGIIIHHKLKTKLNVQKFIWTPTYYFTGSNEHPHPHKRLISYLAGEGKSYGQHFYAVHRSKLLKKMVSETKRYASGYLLGELFMGGMSLIYGKLKWLPVFYSSREINDFQPFNQKYRQVVVFSPENCARAVNGWTKHLTHAEGLTDESARLYANDGMTSRLKLLEHLKRSLDISAVELLKKKILLKCYHFLYGRVFEKKSAEFYNDFQKIKTIVSSACLNSNEVNKIRHDYLKDDQNQQKACP